MATPARLQAFLDKLYTALSSGDLETWIGMHAEDVAFNVNGTTAVSGRTVGKRNVLENLLPLLFTRIRPDTAAIGINWRCMCADQQRATVIFEGRSQTLEGVDYNNRYLQILEFNDEGLICEAWEFFDTALAEAVLFTPDQQAPAGTGTFQY